MKGILEDTAQADNSRLCPRSEPTQGHVTTLLQYYCALCTTHFSQGLTAWASIIAWAHQSWLTESTARSRRYLLGHMRDLTKVFQYVLTLTQKHFRSEDIGLFQPWQTPWCLWKEHCIWQLDPMLQRLIQYLLQAHNSSFSGPFVYLIWRTWAHHVESGTNIH